jgi:acyl dehydratase
MMTTRATIWDVQPGYVLPELTFGPVSRSLLALYAGVSGDHDPVHIDIDFARAAGHPDVFAHGMLTFGVLSRVVTQWCGPERLRVFGARFTSITHVHDMVTCRGRVVERLEADGEPQARIEVVATVQDGRQTLVGEALVFLA